MELIIFVQNVLVLTDFHQNNFFDSMSGFSLQNSCSCKEEFCCVFHLEIIKVQIIEQNQNCIERNAQFHLLLRIFKLNTLQQAPQNDFLQQHVFGCAAHQKTASKDRFICLFKGPFQLLQTLFPKFYNVSVPNPSFACIPCDSQMKIQRGHLNNFSNICVKM